MCFRPAEAELNDHNICPECGTENAPGSTKCTECGAKLSKVQIVDKPTGTNVAAPPPLPGMMPTINAAPKVPGAPKQD